MDKREKSILSKQFSSPVFHWELGASLVTSNWMVTWPVMSIACKASLAGILKKKTKQKTHTYISVNTYTYTFICMYIYMFLKPIPPLTKIYRISKFKLFALSSLSSVMLCSFVLVKQHVL